ncbi:MAG: hypothetical protein ACTSVI_12850 [Promethearchaeota archaeon]
MAEANNDDNFSRILHDVCQKTVTNGRILGKRLENLWKKELSVFDAEMHPIRTYSFAKGDFFNSITKRVEILEQCELIMADAYWAIKMIAIALFSRVPDQLPSVYEEFNSREDIEKFRLKIAEKFVNSLMKFFSVEKDLVSKHVYLYGKVNTLLRVKKHLDLKAIQQMMLKDGFNLSEQDIHEIMSTLQDHGLVRIDDKDQGIYHHETRLVLRPEQEKIVKSHFMPFVEWSINAWRTLFNIRELNTPIPEKYPNKSYLENIVKYAAIQGFNNAYFCFKEIKNYFVKYHEHEAGKIGE